MKIMIKRMSSAINFIFIVPIANFRTVKHLINLSTFYDKKYPFLFWILLISAVLSIQMIENTQSLP